MSKFHAFMRCDHKLPNGVASVRDNEWMPVCITGIPTTGSVLLRSKRSKMTVPTYYCEDCDAEFRADDECCCTDSAFKH